MRVWWNGRHVANGVQLSMGTYKNRDHLKNYAIQLRTEHGYGYHTIKDMVNERFDETLHWSTIRNWTQSIIVDKNEAYKLAIQKAKADRWPKRKEAIKKRLLEERGNRCESCNLSEWLSKPITLEMHRILGGGEYIRENVILLCPNCHSQTGTWRNKNQG